jgi:hypothetical protein
MFETIALWLAMQAVKESAKPVDVDFAKDVRPILEQRCQPCHFAGGKMYAQLPFDKPETVHKLGTKLFTRIKKDKDQAVIRAFLEQKR